MRVATKVEKFFMSNFNCYVMLSVVEASVSKPFDSAQGDM